MPVKCPAYLANHQRAHGEGRKDGEEAVAGGWVERADARHVAHAEEPVQQKQQLPGIGFRLLQTSNTLFSCHGFSQSSSRRRHAYFINTRETHT
jgi:hypothetical protein